jgi:hypothetical protein
MPMFEEISGIQYGSGIKTVLYGQEGVGKSSLAAKIPGIIFIDCEGSTTKMDVRRLPVPTSWAMLCDEMEFVLQNAAAKGYRAVAIDTFDWAEMLVLQDICVEFNVKSIEGIPYGKGWQVECEKVARFLESTDRLIKAGIHVILICHAVTRKTTLPEELDEFDHWELKLGNKTTNKIAPLLKEWSDMTLFLAFRTQVMAADDKGKTHKATSVQRVMYSTKSAWWDAKNRFGLPEMMPLDYGAIAHLFAAPVDTLMQRVQDAGIPTATINVPQSVVQPAQPVVQQTMQQNPAPVNPVSQVLPPEAVQGSEPIETLGADWNGIPDALRNLMQSNKVIPAHIQKITGPEVNQYFPADMPVGNYPQDYHEWLIANWQQVMNDVRANCPDYVPF